MKLEHVSPTVLVLIYCVLVVVGLRNLLFGQTTLIAISSLIVNAIILSALLLVSVRWVLSAGKFFCWVKIALGAFLIVVGAWEVVTFDVVQGLILIAIGAIVAIGLAYWTLKVLLAIEHQSATPESQTS